ncbi:MAG: carboxylating nicotinate-nucleotide diphosphorylase [Deltaproteobacteria bacterium]|nr:carboxylating nicotinate-nucleotide diphosphorylase [Deltaproteobacteria bacterium]
MLNNNPLVRRIVRLALEEDIGTGDATTEAVVPEGTRAAARVVAKAPGVLAGGPVAAMVLEEVDRGIAFEQVVPEGAEVAAGDVVMRASGDARALLVAERTLLDFVMRLGGVATATRRFAARLAGCKTVLLDTRKTTPGLRVLEKYATRIGGARNHRMSLAGGVLVKNNHLALVGDLKDAIRRAKSDSPSLCRVEVEVRTMEEVKRAIEAGADVLLLDHMTREEVREVIDYCNWKVKVEVSGNVTPDAAAAVAEVGPDFVSAGAVTHSAPWMDFAMYLERIEG